MMCIHTCEMSECVLQHKTIHMRLYIHIYIYIHKHIYIYTGTHVIYIYTRSIYIYSVYLLYTDLDIF